MQEILRGTIEISIKATRERLSVAADRASTAGLDIGLDVLKGGVDTAIQAQQVFEVLYERADHFLDPNGRVRILRQISQAAARKEEIDEDLHNEVALWPNEWQQIANIVWCQGDNSRNLVKNESQDK